MVFFRGPDVFCGGVFLVFDLGVLPVGCVCTGYLSGVDKKLFKPSREHLHNKQNVTGRCIGLGRRKSRRVVPAPVPYWKRIAFLEDRATQIRFVRFSLIRKDEKAGRYRYSVQVFDADNGRPGRVYVVSDRRLDRFGLWNAVQCYFRFGDTEMDGVRVEKEVWK